MNYKDQVQEQLLHTHEDEPMILLRASDPHAMFALIKYASKIANIQKSHYSREFIETLIDKVRSWQMVNGTELVGKKVQANRYSLMTALEKRSADLDQLDDFLRTMHDSRVALDKGDKIVDVAIYMIEQLWHRLEQHVNAANKKLKGILDEGVLSKPNVGNYPAFIEAYQKRESQRCPECRRPHNDHDAFCIHADSDTLQHEGAALKMKRVHDWLKKEGLAQEGDSVHVSLSSNEQLGDALALAIDNFSTGKSDMDVISEVVAMSNNRESAINTLHEKRGIEESGELSKELFDKLLSRRNRTVGEYGKEVILNGGRNTSTEGQSSMESITASTDKMVIEAYERTIRISAVSEGFTMPDKDHPELYIESAITFLEDKDILMKGSLESYRKMIQPRSSREPLNGFKDINGVFFTKEHAWVRIDKGDAWYRDSVGFFLKVKSVPQDAITTLTKSMIPVEPPFENNSGTYWVRPEHCTFFTDIQLRNYADDKCTAALNSHPKEMLWQCPHCEKSMHLDAADAHLKQHESVDKFNKETKLCDDCQGIIDLNKPDDHICHPEKELGMCPACGANTYRNGGCDDMYCTLHLPF